MPNTATVNEATAQKNAQQTPTNSNFINTMYAIAAQRISSATQSNLGM